MLGHGFEVQGLMSQELRLCFSKSLFGFESYNFSDGVRACRNLLQDEGFRFGSGGRWSYALTIKLAYKARLVGAGATP